MDFYLIFSFILCRFHHGKWGFVFQVSPSESGGGAGTVVADLAIVFVAKPVSIYAYIWSLPALILPLGSPRGRFSCHHCC